MDATDTSRTSQLLELALERISRDQRRYERADRVTLMVAAGLGVATPIVAIGSLWVALCTAVALVATVASHLWLRRLHTSLEMVFRLVRDARSRMVWPEDYDESGRHRFYRSYPGGLTWEEISALRGE
jgi:hypothetical protein